MRAPYLFLFVCLVATLTVLTGCGDSNPLGRKAIYGTVTLNGAPLKTGAIEFHPLAAGGTQSGGPITDGEYSISEAQGLTLGTYRVRVYATEELPPLPEDHMPGEDVPVPKSLIPPEWNQNSTQQVEIQGDGPYEFDFDILTGAGR